MRLAKVVVVLICTAVGAIDEDDIATVKLLEGADSQVKDDARETYWRLNSTDGRYAAQALARRDAFRDPDRVLESITINDTSNGLQYPVGVSAGDEILQFVWSPNGSSYAFLQDNDIYYVQSPEMKPIRVTHTEGHVKIQASFSWTVCVGGMWISPSDKYLAYVSRSANASKGIMMTTFSRDYAYDYNYNMEYTKTGEMSPTDAAVSIWNTETNKTITLDIQKKDALSFYYLFGVYWVTLHDKEILVVTFGNRWQNETSVTLCAYENATCTLIYEHKYEPAQWGYPDYASTSLAHSNLSMFFLLPEKRGDNAWQHIAKIDITADFRFDSISFLSSGDYDIKRIVAYRAEEDIVLYLAQAPLPWNKHVYGTPVGALRTLKKDQCLTCVHANCTYQEIRSPSPGEQLNLNISCKGPSQPYDAVISLNSTTFLPSETKIFHPSENVTLRNWTIETFLLPSGYEATVMIYGGDSQLTSVPVILHVYGGPDFNLVTDEFLDDPHPIGYKNHAIVHIDVRGSGGRGWKYRSAIYGRLVTVEVEDTLEAMKMVLEKYPRLDKTRVGVFGWSYGGTMTAALVELAAPGFFKCAIVGAPVTNFLSYWAGYSERYMGDAPPSAFTDLTRDVSKFSNTSLLLVHGLRDDNVHFQNSAILIEALQEASIPFQLMVYPNQDHRVKNKAAEHKKKLFETFISNCFT